MLIHLTPTITPAEEVALAAFVRELHYKPTAVRTQSGAFMVATGTAEIDLRAIGRRPGVRDVHYVSDPTPLTSRQWRVAPTVLDLGDGVRIGEGSLTLVAGPCSIEDDAQVAAVLDHLTSQGVRLMRGGVFKPRSSPYAFRGLGLAGLRGFSEQARARGVKVVTEVMEVAQIAAMHDYVDIFQVGARNTQNFNLLDALGEAGKPVLLKRGISGSIDELLASAEYIFSAGNERIILCERGIRTFETAARNTLDLNAVPILKARSHLPVLVDPSHGTGLREHVPAMGLAALMAGADGVIYETHPVPEEAASDGAQTLNFAESTRFIEAARRTWALRQELGIA